MNVEKNMRLQMASTKLDIVKETCKNVKQCHSPHQISFLENMLVFH